MSRLTRRHFISAAAGGFGSLTGSKSVWAANDSGTNPASPDDHPAKEPSVEDWMNEWMQGSKAPAGTLHVSRFKDPIYFLTKPIAWVPNPDQTQHQRVSVPVGFVTDFASIPRVFWSILRPDGEYTYPAIVHDFMYWTQDRARDEADEIFRFGMQDFRIDPITVTTIYEAVRLGGGPAWNGNTTLKAQGERRILKKFPDDPTITWEVWKNQPDVFV
jgi:hypothetical protein